MGPAESAPEHPAIEHDPGLRDGFVSDVVAGLTRPRGEKRIPAKHLYDRRGSELFDRICELDEYYVTRTEQSIFDAHLPEIAGAIGPRAALVEPGAGDGAKAERLLRALDGPAAFAPIEISRAPLEHAARRFSESMPDLEVVPVCADFTGGFARLDHLPETGRAVFFPGSTIGNLERPHRIDLLRSFRDFAGEGGCALVGFDMVKDPAVLRAAYDDREGVTAAFNLNLIDRINRELDAGLDPQAFRHEAPWVESRQRIEMHLVCLSEQRATIDDHEAVIAPGERIHTESSHKFTRPRIDEEAAEAGLVVADAWTDERRWFTLALLRPAAA